MSEKRSVQRFMVFGSHSVQTTKPGPSTRLASFNDSFIFPMIPDPEPNEILPIGNGQCSDTITDTGGPKTSHFLKSHGRVATV